MTALPATMDYKAEVIRQELVSISAASAGVLSPDAVVQRASDPESPLHSLFEWDDTQAAAKFRLVQAGALIRSVKISIVRMSTDAKVVNIESTRAFVAPVGERRSKTNKTGGYAELGAVMSDVDRRANLLASVKAELLALRRKHESLTELAAVWKAVDKL